MIQFAQIDISSLLGFGAVVIAVWNMTTRIDAHIAATRCELQAHISATRSELQAMGARIDGLHRDFNAMHKEIMELIKKMK